MAMDLDKLDKCWLAAHVKPGWETKSAHVLSENGHEGFVPLYQRKRRWSDRIKVMLVPLFPGYVFCKFNVHSRHPVIHTPGVIRFVGFGNCPIPIENSEIEALQLASNSEATCGPYPFVEVGHKIQVKNGPLAGLQGIVVRFKSRDRLVISVNQLRQSMFVELDRFEVA
jgi:transcription antitermination factor NusG